MGTNTQPTTTTRPDPAELLDIFDVSPQEAAMFKMNYLASQLDALQIKVQAMIDKAPKGRIAKYKHQITHLKLQLDDLQNSKGRFIAIKINSTREWDREFVQLSINKVNEEITVIERRLNYLKNLVYPKPNAKPQIDLNAIKENVKIKDVLQAHGIKITWNNFFAIRNENTPSCQFNEKKNVYADYGNGNKGGSVLDLYMALNNCSLSEAIKSLNVMQ